MASDEYFDINKCEIVEILDENGNVVTKRQLCDAEGADIENLSFKFEGECTDADYDRNNLLAYLVDGTSTTRTLKERFDPDFETKYPAANYINNDPNISVCGNGMFAQAHNPGTTIPASWAHPKINYPAYNSEIGVDLDISVPVDSYNAWGGTNFVIQRGSGDTSVDTNTLVGTGDLKCYKVPSSGFCMGYDWSHGSPPIENWSEAHECVHEVQCPGVSVTESGDVIYSPTDRTFNLWQFESTSGFKNVGVDQVASSMIYNYGVCNPMPETRIIAAQPFTEKAPTQVDSMLSLNVNAV